MKEAAYLFVVSWLLAQVEIHVEGAHGWAERLPTWRYAAPWLLRLTNGKPLTGDHLYLILFLVAVLHFPLVFTGFDRAVEGRIVGAYFLLSCVWDFQWFVWNPAWGPARFFRDTVWWFPKRFLGLPVEYFTGYAVALAAVRWCDPAGFGEWARGVATCAALSVVSALVALAWRQAAAAESRSAA